MPINKEKQSKSKQHKAIQIEPRQAKATQGVKPGAAKHWKTQQNNCRQTKQNETDQSPAQQSRTEHRKHTHTHVKEGSSLQSMLSNPKRSKAKHCKTKLCRRPTSICLLIFRRIFEVRDGPYNARFLFRGSAGPCDSIRRLLVPAMFITCWLDQPIT